MSCYYVRVQFVWNMKAVSLSKLTSMNEFRDIFTSSSIIEFNLAAVAKQVIALLLLFRWEKIENEEKKAIDVNDVFYF